MFLDPLPAFGRSVDRGGAAKPSAMEILQYGATSSHALENADHQNATAIPSPKSHIQPIGYDLEISTRLFQFWRGRRILPAIQMAANLPSRLIEEV
jgi:hypothetical protein